MSNYQPISLLSNIEKIYEKILYTRLIDFLDTNKVIYLKQFGFHKADSTVHSLINLVERIRLFLDKGSQFVSVGNFKSFKSFLKLIKHDVPQGSIWASVVLVVYK